MHSRRFAIYGGVFGLAFPAVGSVIEAFTHGYGLGLGGLLRAQAGSPLLWIVDTVPFFLAVLAYVTGRAQDHVVGLDEARRDGYLRTASELFAAAQALLSTVSSFSSMTAETAASVRETTATMGQLSHTATKAALTAETVVGLARSGERTSAEGLSVVEGSLGELTKLADEVRALSGQVQALNHRMRGMLEVASVVNQLADRSRRLAERASAEAAQVGAGAPGFAEVVAEMRSHSDEARRAALGVEALVSELHAAMLVAVTAAEGGIRRAEQGAAVAAGTGETIRRLATALQESSLAAQQIATVAQEQDHGIEEVLKAMNDIYLATQETMASTHAVATEAKTLNALALGLKQAVES